MNSDNIQDENDNNNNNQNVIKHWSRKIALLLQEYAFKSMGNSYINLLDASYYNTLNFKVTLAIGILSGLVTIGFGGILYFVQNKDDQAKIVLYWICTIMSLLLNVVVMILTVYITTKNPVSKVANCAVSASKYGSLYRQIIGEFMKDPSDREDALSLHGHVLTRFNELESEKPFLRDESKEKWEEYTKEIIEHPQNYSAVIKLPEEFSDEHPNNTREFSFRPQINKNDGEYNDSDILLSKEPTKFDAVKQLFVNF